MSVYKPPAPISVEHRFGHFDSGEESLNEWLKKRAIKNDKGGVSRCFVVTDSKSDIIGYYSLSAGAIGRESVPKAMQRNMPNPLPILLLGRLAIDIDHQNKGLGSAMLKDALLRALTVSAEAGIFAVLVHALSTDAKKFYLSKGFVESPIQPMTLMMTLKTVRLVLMH